MVVSGAVQTLDVAIRNRTRLYCRNVLTSTSSEILTVGIRKDRSRQMKERERKKKPNKNINKKIKKERKRKQRQSALYG